MRSDAAALPVAIVGGGFSGTMTAVQLSRLGVPSVLIDGSGRLGRGVAYSTAEAVHLLNVSTDKMTAFPDEPDQFARWCGDDGKGFAQRREFGGYLREVLTGAELVRPVEAWAVEAQRSSAGWRLLLSEGTAVEASALVLANGNQPPAWMTVARDLRPELFVNNPWERDAKRAIARVAERGGDVLMLGTGLTAVDTVLSLLAAGHEGGIVALSRRGLIPRSHAAFEPAPVTAEDIPQGNVLELWRWLRRRSAAVGFRAAVDSLRPHSQTLWQCLPQQEQRRFLRHARPWWDVHRHRIAPEIAQQLHMLVADDRLTIVAGRVESLRASGEELVVSIRRRHAGEARERRFAVAFNCTGPLGEMRRTDDPLLKQLIDDEAVKIDPLGIGLDVDSGSRAGEGIWALGPLTKGRYWEIVAVPDIRGQAAAVAADIAQELKA